MTSLKPWLIDPVWQNYSSMYREAVTAREVRSGFEQSHHLTASLYFAISTLEAYLNRKWRSHFKATKSEGEIVHELRFSKFMEKVRKWPAQITGQALSLRPETLDTISLFNDLRSDLTHPKYDGPANWHALDDVEAKAVIDVVAEFIAQFQASQSQQFEYWLFGWNYLNPRPNSHEIMAINNQQFVFSMHALGEQVEPYDSAASESWRKKFLSDYRGYCEIMKKLSALTSCEPKDDRFPYQPKLCSRWWDRNHHSACGFVTREAIDYAINYGKERERKG